MVMTKWKETARGQVVLYVCVYMAFFSFFGSKIYTTLKLPF